jgi:hypothetical protein
MQGVVVVENGIGLCMTERRAANVCDCCGHVFGQLLEVYRRDGLWEILLLGGERLQTAQLECPDCKRVFHFYSQKRRRAKS